MNTSDKELNLLHILLVLLKNIKTIFINFFIIVLIAICISLILPKYYKSSLTFIPQGPTNSNLLSMLGSSFSGDILGSSKFSKRQYISILNSRELQEEIINKFNLIKVYKLTKLPNSLDKSLIQLNKNMLITEEEEGGLGITDIVSISIDVTDKDPQRASDIANFAFDLLKKKSIDLQSKEFQQMITFLADRRKENDSLFEMYKTNLKEFKLKYKLYDISTQVNMAMQVIGNYQAELSVLNTQKAYLETTNFKNYSDLKSIDQKISILNNKINSIEDNKKINIIPGLKNSLDLSNLYYELMKEVETYSQIDVLLTQQIELAKIKSLKNYSDIFLIDSARPAQWKYKPKRIIIVIAITIFYMFCLLGYLFFKEKYIDFQNNSPSKVQYYKQLLRNALLHSKK